MRAITLGGLGLLLAACGAKVPAPALTEPGPSLEDVCPTTPPTGYRVERGEASHPDRAIALGEARQIATEQLLERLCGGISASRCALVGRAVRPWKDGYHDPQSGFACASVAVDRGVLQGIESDREILDRSLATLAAAIAQGSAGRPIVFAAPAWSEGCDAGIVGDKLTALVTNGLGAHAVALAAADADDAPRVVLTLTRGDEVITVTALLRQPDGTGTALPGFTAPVAFLPLPDDARLGCGPRATVDRDASDRDGLTSWLTDVVTDCERRLGGGRAGLSQWWVRFEVEGQQARGIMLSPGVESPAPEQAQLAVGSCVREELESTAFAEADGVYRVTVQSVLPGSARTAPVAPVAPAPLPPAADSVSLVIRNPSGDWLDVRVDGAVVAELRSHREATVRIAPGVHQIEVLPFLSNDAFFVGRLDTAGRPRVVLGVDPARGSVTAYDGTGLEALPR